MKPKPRSPANTLPARLGLYLCVILAVFLFFLYTHDLTKNPPGFYVDESTFAYNAYSMARTGAGEFGVRWPLFFQHFGPPYTIYGNPVHTYLLAALFVIFPPSIGLARLLSAIVGFTAGTLIGFLAFRVSQKESIGVMVGVTALITPWFFEFSRWFSDASYYPLVLTLFLIALYRANLKPRWSWLDIILIAVTLGFATYTYTIGRLLGPLLGAGLVCFAFNRERLADVLKTWLVYALTLTPLFVFYLRQPAAVSSRFVSVSYLRTEPTLQRLLVKFISRYFQDLSLLGLLTTGDLNPRHHVPGATGSFLLATLVLALIGFVVVLLRHRDEPWWRFVIFGTFASAIPGALTTDSFHTGRMIAYPVFLMVLTIPAFQWLSEKSQRSGHPAGNTGSRHRFLSRGAANLLKRSALLVLVLATLAQATYFQRVFWRDGYSRHYPWDVTYKHAYDVATELPSRPIYLEDGKWGPGYIHALWYATLEGRSKTEFVHLPYRAQPPPGALVLSSAETCRDCEILFDNNHYKVYRKL